MLNQESTGNLSTQNIDPQTSHFIRNCHHRGNKSLTLTNSSSNNNNSLSTLQQQNTSSNNNYSPINSNTNNNYSNSNSSNTQRSKRKRKREEEISLTQLRNKRQKMNNLLDKPHSYYVVTKYYRRLEKQQPAVKELLEEITMGSKTELKHQDYAHLRALAINKGKLSSNNIILIFETIDSIISFDFQALASNNFLHYLKDDKNLVGYFKKKLKR